MKDFSKYTTRYYYHEDSQLIFQNVSQLEKQYSLFLNIHLKSAKSTFSGYVPEEYIDDTIQIIENLSLARSVCSLLSLMSLIEIEHPGTEERWTKTDNYVNDDSALDKMSFIKRSLHLVMGFRIVYEEHFDPEKFDDFLCMFSFKEIKDHIQRYLDQFQSKELKISILTDLIYKLSSYQIDEISVYPNGYNFVYSFDGKCLHGEGLESYFHWLLDQKGSLQIKLHFSCRFSEILQVFEKVSTNPESSQIFYIEGLGEFLRNEAIFDFPLGRPKSVNGGDTYSFRVNPSLPISRSISFFRYIKKYIKSKDNEVCIWLKNFIPELSEANFHTYFNKPSNSNARFWAKVIGPLNSPKTSEFKPK